MELFKKSPFSLRERIEQKIIPEPMSGCWLWMGSIGSHGYAQVRVKEGTTVVHRILYIEKYGAIPEGLELDHLCRLRCCVNPEHLEPVTRRENIRRGVAPSAKQMRQTHCKKGHLFTKENTQWYKTKYGVGRKCAACQSAYRETHREEIRAYNQRMYLLRKGTL